MYVPKVELLINLSAIASELDAKIYIPLLYYEIIELELFNRHLLSACYVICHKMNKKQETAEHCIPDPAFARV